MERLLNRKKEPNIIEEEATAQIMASPELNAPPSAIIELPMECDSIPIRPIRELSSSSNSDTENSDETRQQSKRVCADVIDKSTPIYEGDILQKRPAKFIVR